MNASLLPTSRAMEKQMTATALLLVLAGLSFGQNDHLQHSLLDTIKSLNLTKDLPISPKCKAQLREYNDNLSLDVNSWALKMLDATSKLQSGIMSLNLAELGNFQQCIDTRTTETSFGEILGKYCLGFIQFTGAGKGPNPREARADSLGDLGNLAQTSRASGPSWAICVPDGCQASDVNVLVNTGFQELLGGVHGASIEFTDLFCQTVKDTQPEFTSGAIFTITFLSLLALAVLLSTLYDLYCRHYTLKGPRYVVLIAFSLYSNGKKVFNITENKPEQIPCMNGLKFISMMWVVAGHTYSVPASGPIANSQDLADWANSLHSMFLVSGTLSVDTFFVIAGALIAYGFMNNKLPFNIFLYYIHRYIRLTPPLAMVILVSSTLLQYMGSGPKWPLVYLYFQKNCEDYWWSALLYVQNYVNITNMCVGQTWYLSIDMQLYLISPIILILLRKFPKFSIIAMSVAVVVFGGASFYVAWENDLTAILSNFYGNADKYSNDYYLLTHTRAGPWFVGVILGYFLFKVKQNESKFRMNMAAVYLIWFSAIATLLACTLAGFDTLRGKNYDRWGNSLHIALVRPFWSLAIAWIIFACTCNYGGLINWILSLPIYQVLNRFAYSIYLTHVTMLYMMVFSRKTPDYFSDFHMSYQFWGNLWFSTGLAALLVFGVESPMITLEKVLIENFTNPKTTTTTNETRDNQRSESETGTVNLAFVKPK